MKTLTIKIKPSKHWNKDFETNFDSFLLVLKKDLGSFGFEYEIKDGPFINSSESWEGGEK